jgi:hypothetical protein
VAGTGHEVGNVFNQLIPAYQAQRPGHYEPGKDPTPGEVIDEIRMDLHNNAEGRQAAREGRAIDPARLRMHPTTAPATALYRMPPPSWAGLPPR